MNQIYIYQINITSKNTSQSCRQNMTMVFFLSVTQVVHNMTKDKNGFCSKVLDNLFDSMLTLVIEDQWF